ncbi:sodium-coupled monocarboxylate transporter 1-like [Ostrea edulis]|uniref:sodium-coupled monocarboxylate transporter 1-like n=1 Tax=Ostrea edulis TaxID=37623 RepID=UPI0024AF9409|nr:sodium-coupled monocarboxylate transporter 1-like [Ostrea edulis]
MSNEKLFSFQTGKVTHFTTVDYVLFGLLLVFSAGIGLFFAIKDRRHNDTKTFLMAGGNMNPFPVALSLLASFMSAITLLGTPAEMYNYTTMYYWIGLSYLFVAFGAAHVFMPIFYRLRVRSAYEYLEHRFSKGVRTAGSMTFCFQMLLYMALVLYAPSLALNSVTGFTLWGSVISVGIVCTLYTTIGGMKAVLFTDSFQVGMMFAGLLAILIQGNIELGGFANAWEEAEKSGRVYFTDFSPDPKVRHSAWSLVIGGTFTWVAIYGVNQAQVQRYCTCPSLKKAQLAIWLNFPGLCLILYLCCLIGMVVYAFYSKCDPFSFNLVKTSDQLLPLFVMDVLGHLKGFPGLFVACLFSGALSTISSGLSALAAVVLEDVIKAYFFKNLSENAATNTSKVLAFVFGIICLGLTYVASLLGGVLQAALSLFGMIGGPLLGLFILGMMFPWANKWGAYSGLLLGLVFMFWIGVGAQIYKPYNPKAPINITGCNWNLTTTAAPATVSAFNQSIVSTSATPFFNSTEPAPVTEDESVLAPLYALSYMWYSATAVLFVVVVGLIVSLLTGPEDPKKIDPKLICPLFDILFPYLPEKIRKPMRFGVRHDEVDKESKEGGIFADINTDVLNQEIKVDSVEKGKEREANGFVKTENGNAPTKNGVENGGYAVIETEFVSHL